MLWVFFLTDSSVVFVFTQLFKQYFMVVRYVLIKNKNNNLQTPEEIPLAKSSHRWLSRYLKVFRVPFKFIYNILC